MRTLARHADTVWAMWSHPRGTRADVKAFQDRRLRALMAHAYERVPYYRRLLDRHGVRPAEIREVSDLRRIPTSSKQDLRDLPAEMTVARGLDPARLITVTTSGSSGEPFEVRRTWLEQNLLHLFRLRAQRQLGLRLGDRLVRIARTRPTHRNDNKLLGRLLRGVGLERPLAIGVDVEPAALLARLREFRPDVVNGFANALFRAGEGLDDEARVSIRPRLLITGGEVLTPAMRARLRETWAAPVVETYGSHEFNLLAWECRDTGCLHTCDDAVIVEVMQGERVVEPGERGEVVVTALHAFAMPFIRYRLGDLVTRGAETCACGQPFGTISDIRGRMVDYFRLPGGRWLHPYKLITEMLSEALAWITRYQLIQEREDRIVIRIVTKPGTAPERLRELERFAADAVGAGVDVAIEVVPDIPDDVSGKLRVARSLVTSVYDDVDWDQVEPSAAGEPVAAARRAA